jgi:hypothetical protein
MFQEAIMSVMNGAFINGLDDEATNEKTTAEAPGTATTDYILFSVTVHDTTTGDIYYGLGDYVVAAQGSVTPAADAILGPVVTAGVTLGSCTKIWLSLGGAGSATIENNTFTYINTILTDGGQAATYLLDNLAALATWLKAFSSKITSVGFDLDNEDAPISVAVPLVVALYNHGIGQSPQANYPFTFDAYFGATEWFEALSGVYSGLDGVQPVVGFTLQTYAGGSGNNPTTWTQELAKYIQNPGNKPTGLSSADGFILPILSNDNTAGPAYTPSEMTSHLETWRSTGGSFWATAALFQPGQAHNWADYASGIAKGISP